MTASPNNARRFTLLGVTDDVTDCDCCGKRDLKCTMALAEHDADGNAVGEVYYGRDCGARALGWGVTADRAEKAARGTLAIRGADGDTIYNAWHRHVGPNIEAVYANKATARATLKGGIVVEVWSTFYGSAPEGSPWQEYGRFLWRLAASSARRKVSI